MHKEKEELPTVEVIKEEVKDKEENDLYRNIRILDEDDGYHD
tara:strand:- start:809 stop:934 length:126 start_codon:yes stop_codon:yes gene_type:complete